MSELFNYSKITPTLLLGQKIIDQTFHDSLVTEGVTHVINLWSGIPEPIWKGPVLTLEQQDDGTPRPLEQTKAGVEYASMVEQSKGILYVHCQWGLGRAPSMTYAILRSRGLSQGNARALINLERPKCVGCWEHYIPSIEKALL